MGLGDDVSVGRLTYPGVTILEVKDGVVVFKTPRGSTLSKRFNDITGITLTGMDSFNEAEKLISGSAGKSEANSIIKQIDTRKAEIAKIKTQVGDEAGAVTRLKDTAKRLRAQGEAYSKSAKELVKQTAELRKLDSSAQTKVAKLYSEAKKLISRAVALDRRKKKGEANQLRNQARQLLKQADDLDADKIKKEAVKKRGEAARLLREAVKLRKERKKDFEKHAKHRINESKKRISEAEGLELKAKRLGEMVTARRAQIAKLSKEAGNLSRQSKKSITEAKSLEAQAKDYPAFAKRQKARSVELAAEIVELQGKLDKLASGATDKPTQYPAAIRLYRTAAGRKSTPGQKMIINFRLLSALDRAGWIDEATTQWLLLADREKGAAGILASRPTTFAPKGDSRNTKAVNILQSSVTRISDGPYHTSAVELMVRLMLREGRSKDVIVILKDVSEPKLKVLKATALLDAKDPAGAVSTVTGALDGLGMESLPEALAIRGKGLLAQSGAETDKKKKQKLMLDAALDFMRVATFFPGTERAAEALFNAGKIMASLPEKPNRGAAVRAYQTVAASYAGTPIGKAATDELAKLGVKK
jgi:hypothetical protein